MAGRASSSYRLPEKFPPGEILYQTLPVKKSWRLGAIMGQGGFGLIYKATEIGDDISPANTDSSFVIKVEPLDNGPLFCEFHFYLQTVKSLTIEEWKSANKLRYLGIPQYIGSGQHRKGSKMYRFLVFQHLGLSLQKMFEQKGRSFSEHTAFAVGIRMLDALEYIHSKGYCHADVKAANILFGYSKGKVKFNKVYLIDYGLSCSYLEGHRHKSYIEDPRRAHDGTAEYASRDAHKGVSPSRRGDLEILGYCMLEWLAGTLPWQKVLKDKDRVRDLKIQYMKDLPTLFRLSFGTETRHEGLQKYFWEINKLAYDAKPNYHQLRQFLRSGMHNEWSLGLFDSSSSANGVKRNTEAKAQGVCASNSTTPKPVPTKPTAKIVISEAATATRCRTVAPAKPKSSSSGAVRTPTARTVESEVSKSIRSQTVASAKQKSSSSSAVRTSSTLKFQQPHAIPSETTNGAGAKAKRPRTAPQTRTWSKSPPLHQNSARIQRRKFILPAYEEMDSQDDESENEDLDEDSIDEQEQERTDCCIL